MDNILFLNHNLQCNIGFHEKVSFFRLSSIICPFTAILKHKCLVVDSVKSGRKLLKLYLEIKSDPMKRKAIYVLPSGRNVIPMLGKFD